MIIKVSHSLTAVGAVGVRVPLYLGHSRAHPSPFAVLSVPNLKKVHIYCWVDSGRIANPSLELMLYADFLHHHRATLTTRPRCLSHDNTGRAITVM